MKPEEERPAPFVRAIHWGVRWAIRWKRTIVTGLFLALAYRTAEYGIVVALRDIALVILIPLACLELVLGVASLYFPLMLLRAFWYEVILGMVPRYDENGWEHIRYERREK